MLPLSAKDVEHERRSADDSVYTITGPGQKRPKDWQKALRSVKFKTAFFQFLLDEWRLYADVNVLSGHAIYVALEKQYYCLSVNEGNIMCEDVEELSSNHIEADTRMVFHLCSMLNLQKTISVRTSDTDVFILPIYHVSHYRECNSEVWMDVGLSANNTRRYINISAIVSHLEQPVIDALLALHAFTGSDYTSSWTKAKYVPYNSSWMINPLRMHLQPLEIQKIYLLQSQLK